MLTWVAVTAFVMFAAGYLMRSQLAKLDRYCWRAERERILARLTVVQGQLDEAEIRAQLEADTWAPGDAWLPGAVRSVYAGLIDGEHPERLTLLAQDKHAGDQVLIEIGQGEVTARRFALLCRKGIDGRPWEEPWLVDLPEACSPEWRTG